MTRLWRAMAAAALALAAAPAWAQTADGPVDPAVIAKLETTAALPAGAAKLDGYDRYYARARMAFLTAESSGERDVVAGVYLRHGPGNPLLRGATPIPGSAGAYTLGPSGELPLLQAGGCDVLTLYFDVKTEAFLFRGARPEPGSRASAVCNPRS